MNTNETNQLVEQLTKEFAPVVVNVDKETPFEVGSREVWRRKDIGVSGFRQTYKILFEKIVVQFGWNVRLTFDGIKELAVDILQNGLNNPLQGDLSADGEQFILRDGERRYRAIGWLIENGYDYEYVEVIPYPSKMTELDKFFSNLSTDKKLPYSQVEMAGAVLRLKRDYALTNTEIGNKLGYSRQWVENMLILAKAPKELLELVNSGEEKYTNVVNQQRDKIIKEKTPLSSEFKDLTKSNAPKKGEDRLPGMEGDITGGGNDKLEEIETPIMGLFKTMYKNMAMIEGLGKGLKNEQSRNDLDTYLGSIRFCVDALKAETNATSNKFERISVGAVNELVKFVNANKVSDGYHTFEELYAHRIEIYIRLCHKVALDKSVWRSEYHSDGTSYDGWFILGIGKEKGEQITYHLPMHCWNKCAIAETLDKSPEWDGHTSEDVLYRISQL